MTKLKQLTLTLQRLQHSTFIGVLALCASLLVTISAFAQNWVNGPDVVIDTLSDAGNGKIKVSWSLETLPADQTALNDHPKKVCAKWATKVNGERGEVSEVCITSGISTQKDIEIDTDLNANAPPTIYTVALFEYYKDYPEGGLPEWEDVTLNALN